jgi:hypothetical protein
MAEIIIVESSIAQPQYSMESNTPSEFQSTAFDPANPPPISGQQAAPFQCRICGQVFTNQADLTEHMVVAHKENSTVATGPGKNDTNPPAGVG